MASASTSATPSDGSMMRRAAAVLADEEAGGVDESSQLILPEDIDQFPGAVLINAEDGSGKVIVLEVGEHGLSLRAQDGFLLKAIPLEHIVQYGKKADKAGALYFAAHISKDLEQRMRMLLRTDDADAIVASIHRFAERRAEVVVEELIKEEEAASPSRRTSFGFGLTSTQRTQRSSFSNFFAPVLGKRNTSADIERFSKARGSATTASIDATPAVVTRRFLGDLPSGMPPVDEMPSASAQSPDVEQVDETMI